MKKNLNLLVFLFCLLGYSSYGQIEFNADTTIRPSKPNVTRLAISPSGQIRIVPKVGNTILLASGTITSINGKATPSVTLTTADIAESGNQYFTSTRVQTVGDARYPQTGLTYNDPSWITGLSFSKIASKPTTLNGYGVTDGVSTSSTYTNPSWLTSLVWTKISSTPTTVGGYGITDAVNTSTTYNNPTWLTGLAWSKVITTPTTLTGYGITDAAPSSTTIPYTTVATYAAAQSLSVSGIRLVVVTSDEQYNESNSLYFKFNTALYKVVRNVE